MIASRSSDSPSFHHERLDVYVASLDFVSVTHEVIASLPRGRAALADQLERAATSVALNIAEGSGEFRRKEKVRFYRMALRSAAEAAAILDVARRLGSVSEKDHERGQALANRVAAMLTALVKRIESV